ncbi:hypothetical protein [Lysinibacillus sphaericus]|uniref:Uncharacterized protein n=1 Tax=Lysinibacillus sphaericus OT4b.31 TaxID=1285586 RepID=R7ZDT4_LYSSH|nr:hypothetical protein [Lysinibacillus sphaericus]EON72258.1 hypothetical protein H131_11803 [Lysinibacillus sphaericus OT4b.31]
MKKVVYEVNNDGYVIETYVAEVGLNDEISDIDKQHMVSITIPNGLFKPKWNGVKWIEGATQEEIDEITKVEPSPPNEREQTIELLKKQNQALSKMNTDLSKTNAELKKSIALHDGIISELVLKMFDEDTEVM